MVVIVMCTFIANNLFLLNPFFEIKNNRHVLILVCSLAFVLTFFLASFIKDYYEVKKKSFEDIIFLFIFFILLIIPISHTNQQNTCPVERRQLAFFYPVIIENKINLNFGKDFDNWISDRFLTRTRLIKCYKLFLYKFSYKYVIADKLLYNKETHWSFLKSQVKPYNMKTSHKSDINKALIKLLDYCKENNIKFYFMVVPRKSAVYPDEASSYINTKILEVDTKDVQDIANSAGIKIIYPKDKLKEASKNAYTFYKSEHHWSEYGAYIGYLELINEIKKDFPDVIPLNESDYIIQKSNLTRSNWDRIFNIGTNYYYLGLKDEELKKLSDAEYEYYDFKDKDNVIFLKDNQRLIKIYHYDKAPNIKVILTGRSMNENLLDFIPYNFRDLMYLRLNSQPGLKEEDEFKLFMRYKDEIERFKPDIIILCLNYRKLKGIADLFSEDGN